MIVRPQRKLKPPHKQLRPYITRGVAEVLAQEKTLPEDVWQSVKKAVGIEGKFVPPQRAV